jgi:hypothetical protein
MFVFRRDLGEEGIVGFDESKWASKELYLKYALLFFETASILDEELFPIVPDGGSRARKLLLAHHDDFAAMCRMCDVFGIEVERRQLMFEVGVGLDGVMCISIHFVFIFSIFISPGAHGNDCEKLPRLRAQHPSLVQPQDRREAAPLRALFQGRWWPSVRVLGCLLLWEGVPAC